MKCLFLDIASHKGLVACVTEAAVGSAKVTHARLGDDELLPLIESALTEAGWTYGDLTQLACVVGPGGFTSLRMAVTCINILRDQLNIPSAAVHLSDLYAAWVSESSGVWLHSTKRDLVFCRSLGGFAKQYAEPTLLTVEELQGPDIVHAPWSGELLPEHQALLTGQQMTLAETETVLPEFLSNLSYKKTVLEPWYGRGY